MVAGEKILEPDTLTLYMKTLGECIAEFICKQGYKPSEKAKIIIKVPSTNLSCDPTFKHATIGGKVKCNLTATKDQYVIYASDIINELKKELKVQIEKTWKNRLIEYLDSLFYGKYPYPEDEPTGTEEEFDKKSEEFIAKIQALVDKFEIP